MKLSESKGKCSEPAVQTCTGPWGQMESTQGYQRRWQKCSLKPPPSPTCSPGELGKSQLPGGYHTWCASTEKAGRRVQGATGLSVSVPGKLTEQIILSANYMLHTQESQGLRPSQHGFMKGRSCSNNIISIYDKETCLVDDGKTMDIAFLGFSKAFDNVSHSLLLEKLTAHGRDGSTLGWVKNGWLGQKLVVNEVESK